MIKPSKINILGQISDVLYEKSAIDVDVYKRESLFGQYDPWTRIIRVYDNGRKNEAILETLLHEILHAIALDLKLKCFNGEEGHEELDKIALALTDVLTRNNWVR